jgi:hypothetical protein
MTQPSRTYFSQPWGYLESISIALAILLLGIGIEKLGGNAAPVISFPYNIITLGGFIALCIFLHKIALSNPRVAWFSSIPASIGAFGLFLMLTLIMALVQQHVHAPQYLFIFTVTSSWAYYLATAYLLLVLGMVTIRRLGELHRVNISFFLNHAGLWITIATASLGAGDVEKLRMVLTQDETEWRATDNAQVAIELDFALQLYSFEKEEYPAKLAFVDAQNGEILPHNRSRAIFEADTVSGIHFGDYHVAFLQYLPSSIYYAHAYQPIHDYGATQSYLVEVTHKPTKEKTSGWIAGSSVTQEPRFLLLQDSLVLAALQPQAKRYASYVKVYTKSGEVFDAVIEVNKPISVGGYKIYQTGYDEKKGRWSDISILELVRDPWLPYVYFGLFLFIAGTGMIIWFGKKR